MQVTHGVLNTISRPGDWSSHAMCALLLHQGDSRYLTVHLEVPLDVRYPAESRIEAIVGSRFVLDYHVDVNLPEERRLLRQHLHDLYRREDSGMLFDRDARNVGSMRALFMPLAVQGAALFHRMFVGFDQVNGIPHEYLSGVKAAVRSSLSHAQTICIDSDLSLFPWAFLYDDPNFNPANPRSVVLEAFWGFRHQIQHQNKILTQAKYLPPRPASIVAICPEVGAGHAVQYLVEATTCEPIQTVNSLASRLSRFDADVLYFYGHGGHESPPHQTNSWLEMNQERLTVTSLVMTYGGAQFLQAPVLVFLNSCRSAPLDDWNDATVIGYLVHSGANRLCCVAPVAEVPDWFAATLSEEFWMRFLSGAQVGAALLGARLSLLARHVNPLGLLYELFGRVETCLRRDSSKSSIAA